MNRTDLIPGWPIAALLAAAATVVGGWGTIESAAAACAAICSIGLMLGMALERSSRVARSFLLLSGAGAALATVALAPLLPGVTPQVPGLALAAGSLLAALAGQALIRERQQLVEQVNSLQRQLARRDGDVRAQADRIRRLDLQDPVTGLLNRSGFADAATLALEECAREGAPIALLMIELGAPLPERRSGESNDRATRFARALRHSVRGSDLAGRWDDRVLALLLPHCRDTRPALERLSQRMSGLDPDRRWVWSTITLDQSDGWPSADGLLAAGQAALARERAGLRPSQHQLPLFPSPIQA